jgi:hypothetical protein
MDNKFKYVCPISGEQILQGVMLSDGFVYEKSTIEQYLKVPIIKFDVEYPLLVHSPYTKEKLSTSIIKEYKHADRINRGHLDQIKCCITQEIVKVPYVIFSDKGPIQQIYDHDALVDYIINICKNRKKNYYYNYNLESLIFNKQNIVIIPDKSLMIMLEVSIGNRSMQMFTLKPTKVPTCQKIFSLDIRKLFRQELFCFESLKQEFIKNEIPVIKKGYCGNEIVIMNLDLSRMQIVCGFKGCVFYNCNLSNSIISGSMPRCQFNYCNMKDTMIDNSCYIGEEVSFLGSTLDNVKICDDFQLEKGNTWNPCQNLAEVRHEMLKRGATSTTCLKIFNR